MSNLIPLKFCSKISDFIPYEEHHLMSKEKRLSNPIYCPDTYPFLCKKDTIGYGYCKQKEVDCTINSNSRLPINYRP